MIRKLLTITMIGAIVGVLALAVINRLQSSSPPEAQMPAELQTPAFASHGATARDLFP